MYPIVLCIRIQESGRSGKEAVTLVRSASIQALTFVYWWDRYGEFRPSLYPALTVVYWWGRYGEFRPSPQDATVCFHKS